MAREADIFKVEENGSESCELSPNSSFILVRVPIRVVGESDKRATTVHYSIGSFCARGSMLPLAADGHTTLRFRIPLQLFRPHEPFSVEFLAGSSAGPEEVLWAKRWEVAWRGKAPALEPIAD